jgi:hypothetical protein
MVGNMKVAHVLRRMNATGIGYAGIDGVWWLPATTPFEVPIAAREELHRIAEAMFALFDVVSARHEHDEPLRTLLTHKVPPHIAQYVSPQRVFSVRPDFQLLQRPDRYSFIATELEICPSAQGYAHAMQMGYGLRPDLVEAMAKLLAGRELLFVCTRAWSAFLWEQLAFCAALEKHGARGRVWYDAPIATLVHNWTPPMFGVSQRPLHWDNDVTGRVRRKGWERFIFENPVFFEKPGLANCVIFRFGYFDGFSGNVRSQLREAEARGAIFLNSNHFAFDSKVVMAALQLPEVRRYLDATMLDVLDRAIPETHVLTEEMIDRFVDEKDAWVLKFAGFDAGQQAWGGRSLQMGAALSQDEWMRRCRAYCQLPFPVVAQRASSTTALAIDHIDRAGHVQRLHGKSRVRSFFVRNGEVVQTCGTHLTVSAGDGGVSESTDAVQAPIVFEYL